MSLTEDDKGFGEAHRKEFEEYFSRIIDKENEEMKQIEKGYEYMRINEIYTTEEDEEYIKGTRRLAKRK